MLKTITITVEEEVAQCARKKAAEQNTAQKFMNGADSFFVDTMFYSTTSSDVAAIGCSICGRLDRDA